MVQKSFLQPVAVVFEVAELLSCLIIVFFVYLVNRLGLLDWLLMLLRLSVVVVDAVYCLRYLFFFLVLDFFFFMPSPISFCPQFVCIFVIAWSGSGSGSLSSFSALLVF